MAEMLWELKNLSTDEVIKGPMPLPENWGPIFGMAKIKDKIGNLDWLDNPRFPNHGWIKTATPAGEQAQGATPARKAKRKAKALLRECDWAMLPDEPMTVGIKQAWIAYRVALREIKNQAGFPQDIVWPTPPA